ncbi:GDSL-type esterase/lipase family protein [Sphingomonas sp. 2SG]|uniref:GDSL-type esterase/lipase family protein n=1 Tax=Sphingomonas sp. 2SG TaxID=2502201 RepID=UPI0010F573F1|nr:GDSL-type esterase/lipase family protein [Sphingomonas sp. 2SG]
MRITAGPTCSGSGSRRRACRCWSSTGILGNRTLKEGTGASLLNRFDSDVLDVPAVGYVIVLEGINDLGVAVREAGTLSSAPLVEGLRQVIARARTRGLEAIGGTIMPLKGSKSYREDAEKARQEVNAWIRTPGVVEERVIRRSNLWLVERL